MEIIPANDRHEDILALMTEYVDWLMQNDDKMKEVLANQHLDDEIADFNIKYAPPVGRLYLALVDGQPAGCIALSKWDAPEDGYGAGYEAMVCCECKRLYVRPEYRGHKIGQKLIERIISDARQIGYTYMRLDSFPFMASAVKLYAQYGFYPIGNYCGNPSENALFFELKL